MKSLILSWILGLGLLSGSMVWADSSRKSDIASQPAFDSALSVDGLQFERYKLQLVELHRDILLRVFDKQLIQYIQSYGTTVLPMEAILLQEQTWNLSKKARENITGNKIALRFKSLVDNKRLLFNEIMLTDINGLLLAAYPETTDYWQGDEDKFQRPVLRHDAYISEVKWDLSTQHYSFFYAKPIIVGGKVLAVLIAGIGLSEDMLRTKYIEQLLQQDVNSLIERD